MSSTGDGQRIRRRELSNRLVDFTSDNWDADGNWVADRQHIRYQGSSAGLRMRLYYAQAYFESDRDVDGLANAIIENGEYGRCAFAPFDAARLLLAHPNRLSDAGRSILLDYLDSSLERLSAPAHDFSGHNDNFPAMSMGAMLLGGRLLGTDRWTAVGRRRLSQLEGLLSRRGVLTEYNSPTYTPLTTFAVAGTANHVDDESIADRLLDCEARLWVDLLGHFHPATAQPAGPYSRAYTVDSAGHTHHGRLLLYAVLGEDLPITPLDTLFSSREGAPDEIIHSDAAFMQAEAARTIGAVYHPPDDLLAALREKPSPFRFAASTEYGTDGTRPAGSGHISTYMTDDYALGIATDDNGSGADGAQVDAFHLLDRRSRPVTSQADVGTIYARYVVNERVPGQRNYHPADHAIQGPELLRDEGHKRGLQKDNIGLVVYTPRLTDDTASYEDLRSLKLSLLFPIHAGRIDALRVGEDLIALDDDSWSTIERTALHPVAVRDGPVYAGFRPLVPDTACPAPLKVERFDDFLAVSFYNYDDTRPFEPVDPPEGAVDTLANGFAVEVRSRDEVPDFDSFVEAVSAATVTDRTRDDGRLRTVGYERGETSLSLEYSHVGQGIKYATVGGSVPTRPNLAMTGLDGHDLPLI